MPFQTLDGTTVLFPTVSARALANVTPVALVDNILAANRNLRYRNLAESDVDSIFKEMLARASVTSYEIKAEFKGILERWDFFPDWAAVRRILRRVDVDRSGRISKPSIPSEFPYPKTGNVLPVQHLSERTREKLAGMGKTLRVYLPSRVKRAALTNVTHIHLLGHNKKGELKLYEVEIVAAFHPSVAVEFESRSLLNRFLDELPKLAFSFDSDRVANVAAEKFDATAHDTIYTLGSGPIDESSCAIHESLKRFFVNKGYIEHSDVVSNEENGVKKTYVQARVKGGPKFMRNLTAVPGSLQDRLVPATFAGTCTICRPDNKRPQVEYQARVQVETQSRHELDFCPTGPPKVRLPGQKVTPVGLEKEPNTRSPFKRKRDFDSNNTAGLKTLVEMREDVDRQLKVAKQTLESKLKPKDLIAGHPASKPLHDARKGRTEKGRIEKVKVAEHGPPPKQKRESSPHVTGLAQSGNSSKDRCRKPKSGDKEAVTSEDGAKFAIDWLTELEKSLNF